MNPLLGLRLAAAGGREAAARMALMAVGVAVGVVLVLVSLTVLPIMQGHIDRLAWHRTDAASPATAPDPARWLAVTDRFAGRDVIRVQVAALGPRPPVPPGLDRLPAPGEVFVSPALAELFRTVPADQLRDRFPGRVAGVIGPAGLVRPDELVGISGRTPQELAGAIEIDGIEQPGERLDLYAMFGVLAGLLTALIIGPVAVFVAFAARVGGVRRERRFTALRLAGATRWQVAVLACAEAAAAALAGIAAGLVAFLALRPVVARAVDVFPADVRLPVLPAVLALAATLLLVVAVALVMAGTAFRPLRRVRRGAPRAWRLIPLVAGVVGWRFAQDVPGLSLLAPLATLAGIQLSGPWVCYWLSRGLARIARRPSTLLVARRMAANPAATFGTVGGVALAVYAATAICLVDTAGQARPAALDDGVVAVHVQGAPEESLTALRTPGTVVARLAPGGTIVLPCADLARVTGVDCPWPAENYALENVFTLPFPGVSGADHIFTPRGWAEPGAHSATLPVQTIFIPTDGSPAAVEAVRTLAARTVPAARSKTVQDLTGTDRTPLSAALPYALVFVLLVAAAGLTVAAINGVLERRRPLALLRASGVRLGELRTVVLLEIAIPLAVSTLIGTLIALPTTWQFPGAGFYAGLGAGVAAAFAVSLIALPFTDAATRYDRVAFE